MKVARNETPIGYLRSAQPDLLCYNFSMRRGFLYIHLQIYIALLVLLLGGALVFTTGILRRDMQMARQLRETALLENALDILSADLKYADRVELAPESALVVKQNTEYTYFLNNRRLARRKDSYLYFTPASLQLDKLTFTAEGGLIKVVLTVKQQTYERLVAR